MVKYNPQNADTWYNIFLGLDPANMISDIKKYMSDTGINESYILDDYIVSLCGIFAKNVSQQIVPESSDEDRDTVSSGTMNIFRVLGSKSTYYNSLLSGIRLFRILKDAFPSADTYLCDEFIKVVECGVPNKDIDLSINMLGLYANFLNNINDVEFFQKISYTSMFGGDRSYFSNNILELINGRIEPVSFSLSMGILRDIYVLFSRLEEYIRRYNQPNSDDVDRVNPFSLHPDISSPKDFEILVHEYNSGLRNVFESFKAGTTMHEKRVFKNSYSSSFMFICDEDTKLENHLKLIN